MAVCTLEFSITCGLIAERKSNLFHNVRIGCGGFGAFLWWLISVLGSGGRNEHSLALSWSGVVLFGPIGVPCPRGSNKRVKVEPRAKMRYADLDYLRCATEESRKLARFRPVDRFRVADGELSVDLRKGRR